MFLQISIGYSFLLFRKKYFVVIKYSLQYEYIFSILFISEYISGWPALDLIEIKLDINFFQLPYV